MRPGQYASKMSAEAVGAKTVPSSTSQMALLSMHSHVCQRRRNQMSDIIVIKGTVPNANFFFCHCLQGYFSISYARILMSKPQEAWKEKVLVFCFQDF